MATRLVNTEPGDGPEPIKPGQPIHLGFKSEALEVQLGTALVDVAYSGLTHVENKLPEQNAELGKAGMVLSLETSERRRPLTGEISRSIVSGSFQMVKTTGSLGELAVYEMKMPVKKGNSLLAHFKIRKKDAWTPQSPDWTNLTNVVGPFLGLEHSTFNTGAFVFLRDDGVDGTIVLGGPLSAFGAARPGQVQTTFEWKTLTDDEPFEVFIYLNTLGEPPPFLPTFVPMVEVWTKMTTDATPVLKHRVPLGSLGQFPDPSSSSFPNSRSIGDADTATLYLGNLGLSGEVLQVDDWAFYPEYRQAVLKGEPRPDHGFDIRPDGPVVFSAAENVLPSKVLPGKWFTLSGGQVPVESFSFNPGARSVPTFCNITKPATAGVLKMGFQKTEPRLEARDLGVVIEGVVAGEVENTFGSSLGMGFGVDDGAKSYRMSFLFDGTTRTIGVAKQDNNLDDPNSYYVPMDGSEFLSIDHRSLKFVRMVVDRLRSKLLLFVEDEDQPVLTTPLTDPFPTAIGTIGRVFFGHSESTPTFGRFSASSLRYLMQYKAWEGVDLQKPDHVSVHADARFIQAVTGAGSAAVVGSSVVITKPDFNTPNSTFHYTRDEDLSHQGGVQVDFRMAISGYSDKGGRQNAPITSTGVGVRVFFGNKLLHLGFYDCGLHGRKIAILPGSGTEQDILTQSALGRKFSADADFSAAQTYRLVYKAFDKIEVWSGTLRNKPIISIPWRNDTDAFDLPLEAVTPASIAFGHFDALSSSVSKWEFIRWGRSNGYETAVRPVFYDYPRFLFGGRVFIRSKFDEA